MRLICGVWHLDGAPASAETLEAMARGMIAPGLNPRIRTWREGPIGLAVIDFSRGPDRHPSLPRSDDGRVLAADVRLDDPRALSRTLKGESCGDEDLLLAALRRWDVEAPVRILGDYAFAAWNPKRQTLLCARDALGVRPFVYVHQPGRLFGFASLPRALHGTGLVERRLDETALVRRVLLAWHEDDTLFTDVHRLPAAHLVEVSPAGLSRRRYWQLDRARAGTLRITPEDASQELRRVIEDAVSCRVPATGPVAAHMSGGLDSSSIAILATRRLRAESRTLFAYSFLARQRDLPSEDETPFVDAIRAQETDIAWTPIHAPAFPRYLAARMDIDRLLSIEGDDPENAICEHGAAQGARVVLSGWGGDEGATFNGRGALAEAFLHGRWRHVAAEFAALQRTRGWSPANICRGEILSYLTPRWLMNAQRRLRRRPVSALRQLHDLVKLERSERLDSRDTETLGMRPDARVNRVRLLASPHIAERTENWASIGARYGIAFAFPMLDRRVVEFAVSLPSALFLRGGFKRRVFRDAMEGVLPDAVRWRHQKLVPLPDLLTGAAEHREAIVRYLETAAGHPRVRELFELDGLRAVVASLPSPDAVRADTADLTGLVVVMACLPAISYVEQHY